MGHSQKRRESTHGIMGKDSSSWTAAFQAVFSCHHTWMFT